jgi:hypothetical protein
MESVLCGTVGIYLVNNMSENTGTSREVYPVQQGSLANTVTHVYLAIATNYVRRAREVAHARSSDYRTPPHSLSINRSA